MPRKPTARAIKAAVAKHNPQRVHVIHDACATKGCFAAPVKGSGFCAEHIMGPGREVEAEKSKKADSPPPPVRKSVPQKAETSTPEAITLVETLREKGWSDAEIGFGVGIPAGKSGKVPRDTVWSWRKGKTACPKLAELRALLELDAPSKPAKEKPAKTVKGSLKAPRARAESSPRVGTTKLTDPRQLLLALEGLRDTLDVMLSMAK